jgi:hypothetical protein
VFVGGEFFGGAGDLEEFFSGSVSGVLSVDGSEEVVSEEADGFDGVRVFLKGSNEDLGRVTSLVLEFNFSSGDIGSSGIDPFEVGVGVGDFFFDVLSVGGGGITSFFVNIGDFVQVSDFVVASFLLGSVFRVFLSLGIIVGLSQIV